MRHHPAFTASFLRPGDLVIDSFAGGGGASTGLEQALGRPVDIAINHSPEAIAMHRANHPSTRHYCENIWQVDPREATGGRPVAVAWFSPDCTHFSRAKGTSKRSDGRRGLAWVVLRWAHDVRPRVICLENVPEFETWGPLRSDGTPDPERAGSTFRQWLGRLRALGYDVAWRTLVAADYGTPTTRKRLFLVARRDGQPIVWPEPTHQREQWRAAAEVIDWSIPCPSIFGRARPLAEATMRRIAEGVRRYVVEAGSPFIVKMYGTSTVASVDDPLPTVTTGGGRGGGHLALAAPTLIQTGYGERPGQTPRALDLQQPLGTVVAGGAKHALVAAFLARNFTGVVGRELTQPLPTVTTQDHHSLVAAFLTKYYGAGESQNQGAGEPLHTVTTKARFGLVTVHGEQYRIADIGMRMLQPLELFAAQGFPADYQIDADADGRAVSKTTQIALCGNSVCPPVAAALVAAQTRRTAQEAA